MVVVDEGILFVGVVVVDLFRRCWVAAASFSLGIILLPKLRLVQRDALSCSVLSLFVLCVLLALGDGSSGAEPFLARCWGIFLRFLGTQRAFSLPFFIGMRTKYHI